jgi:hypothetical protein
MAISVLEPACRRLFETSARDELVESIAASAPSAREGPDFVVDTLLDLHRAALKESVERLHGKSGFAFSQLRSDSRNAHQKAAEIQQVLLLLGFHLGPVNRFRGYYGGPPGKPVALPLARVNQLRVTRSRTQKLLGVGVESWTRDGVRRLQGFLGVQSLPPGLARAGCLIRPDGLFGNNTLGALEHVLSH